MRIGIDVELVIEKGWLDEDGNEVIIYKFKPTGWSILAVIVGVGIHRFGRFPEKSYVKLAEEAIEMALKNAERADKIKKSLRLKIE